MTALLHRLFPSWHRRLGLAGQPWSVAGARVLAMHIAATTWGRGMPR